MVAKSPRSTRIGADSGTLPAGNATTTVSADPWGSPGCEMTAVVPSADASAQLARLPTGPAKQVTCVTVAGPLISARAAPIGTVHSAPTTFQYSSTWSGKKFRTPPTV